MTSASDPVDVIAAALSRLRGRRGPKPWEGAPGGAGPSGFGGTWQRGFGPRPHGDPERTAHEHGSHQAPHHGSHHGGPHGMPGSWADAMAGRMAGAARLRLLEALAAASVPLSVSEVAGAIGVDQPRASRLVQQAVDSGHVRREADPDDARRTRVVVTDAGRELVEGFRGQRRGAVAAALEGFSDDERAQLAELLTRLADAWPRG